MIDSTRKSRLQTALCGRGLCAENESAFQECDHFEPLPILRGGRFDYSSPKLAASGPLLVLQWRYLVVTTNSERRELRSDRVCNIAARKMRVVLFCHSRVGVA